MGKQSLDFSKRDADGKLETRRVQKFKGSGKVDLDAEWKPQAASGDAHATPPYPLTHTRTRAPTRAPTPPLIPPPLPPPLLPPYSPPTLPLPTAYPTDTHPLPDPYPPLR